MERSGNDRTERNQKSEDEGDRSSMRWHALGGYLCLQLASGERCLCGLVEFTRWIWLKVAHDICKVGELTRMLSQVLFLSLVGGDMFKDKLIENVFF